MSTMSELFADVFIIIYGIVGIIIFGVMAVYAVFAMDKFVYDFIKDAIDQMQGGDA